jgi:hypothetical protein
MAVTKKKSRTIGYAVMYKAFGKWNWFEKATFTKKDLQKYNIKIEVGRMMRSKVKIVDARIVLGK